MAAYSHVIWDWNGTLLDDVDWCLQTINHMLGKRKMKTLSNLEEYQDVFGFPITDYYQRIGFNFAKEPFELLAEEYMSIYHGPESANCKLHTNAPTVLKTIEKQAVSQTILSASEKQNLLSQVANYAIAQYFEEILGIADIYAKSKIEIGLEYITRANVKRAVLIGDTVHDYEVAKAIGADCILIASGHHHKQRLLTCGVCVLDDVEDVLQYVCI